MKILLFGKDGQVGWELQRSLSCLGEVIALGSRDEAFCGDFLDLDGIAATVRAIAPDVIVNAAAYTAVDKAETDSERCRTVNALAPGVLAREAVRLGALLIHYSTDYVFDGSGACAWSETDVVHPLNVYGKTKLEGEEAIAASGCRHLIFRTSWVYAARGGNFAKTMLRLAGEREALSVIDDQIGAPTGADLLADVTAQAIARWCPGGELSGIYHLAAAGETSWHGYASFVIAQARAAGRPIRVAQQAIAPVPTTAFPTPASRPLNSRLNTQKLQHTFSLTLPAWQTGVMRMLTEHFENLT
ncbi:dTDP-4-dehydrorhamnose reductase [compost metagenome]